MPREIALVSKMTLTLIPETEARLRTLAEGFGLEPAELYEELLRRALTKAEAKLHETLAEADAEVS